MRPDNCILNTQKICTNAKDYHICEQCDEFSQLTNGICECAKNSQYNQSEEICQCPSDYIWKNSICTPKRYYLRQSDIGAAQLNKMLDILTIHFNTKIAQSSKNLSCNELFIQAYVDKLGTDPNCYWSKDMKKLMIKLSPNATVKNEVVQLNPVNITQDPSDKNAALSFSYTSLTVQIEFTVNPEPPTVGLKLVDKYSLFCDKSNLEVSAIIRNSNGRQIQFQWSASDYATPVHDFVRSQENLNFSIPSTLLNDSGQLKISIQINDMFGNSKTENAIVSLIAEDSISIDFSLVNPITLTRGDSIKNIAKDISPCKLSPLIWKWEAISAEGDPDFIPKDFVSASNNPHVLKIKRNRLNIATYHFQVTATYESTEVKKVFTVHIKGQDLQAKLNLINSDWPIYKDLQIDCGKSIDPDNPDQKLNYEWGCAYINENEIPAPCYFIQGNGVNKYIQTLLVPQTLLDKLQYTFSCTVSTQTKAAVSTSVTLNVKDVPDCEFEQVLSIEKVPVQQVFWYYVNINSQESFNLNWQVNTPSSTLLSTTIPFFSTKQNTFQQGSLISLQISASLQGGHVDGNITLQINELPTYDSFKITYSTNQGIEIIKIVIYGAFDVDGPVSIACGMLYGDEQLYMSPSSLSSTCQLIGFPAMKEIIVNICDIFGDCVKISKPYESAARRLEDDPQQLYYSLQTISDNTLQNIIVANYSFPTIPLNLFTEFKQAANDYMANEDESAYCENTIYQFLQYLESMLNSEHADGNFIKQTIEQTLQYIYSNQEQLDYSILQRILSILHQVKYQILAEQFTDIYALLKELSLQLPLNPNYLNIIAVQGEDVVQYNAIGKDMSQIDSSYGGLYISPPNQLEPQIVYKLEAFALRQASVINFNFEFSQIGEVSSAGYDLYDRPIAYTEKHTFIATVGWNKQNQKLVAEYSCSPSCSVIEFSQDYVKFEIYGAHSVKIQPIVNEGIGVGESLEVDDIECEMSYVPILLNLGIYFIAVIWGITLVKCKQSKDKERTTKIYMEEPYSEEPSRLSNLPSAVQNIRESIIESPNIQESRHLNSEDSSVNDNALSGNDIQPEDQGKNYQIILPTIKDTPQPQSPLKGFLNHHLLLSTLTIKSIAQRLTSLCIFTVTLAFSHCLLGLLYLTQSPEDPQQEDIQEILKSYGEIDILLAIFAISMAQCLGIVLRVLFVRCNKHIGYGVAGVFWLTSAGIILGLSMMYCEEASSLWSLGILVIFGVEVLVFESLLAVVRVKIDKQL